MIASFIDGRVRIRTAALRNPATLAMVENVIRAREGVRSVQSNPRTGSLLVEYDPEVIPRSALLEAAKALEDQLAPAGAEKASDAEKPSGKRRRWGRLWSVGGKGGNPSEICVPSGRIISRRAENLLLGSMYAATLAGGLVNRRAHVGFGVLFTLLAGAHVFARRRCL